eukprot:8774540-Pyramimonas_sp.AAC.1
MLPKRDRIFMSVVGPAAYNHEVTRKSQYLLRQLKLTRAWMCKSNQVLRTSERFTDSAPTPNPHKHQGFETHHVRKPLPPSRAKPPL